MSNYDKPDQSFDSLTEKFQRNIYGTTKGRLRHELLLHGVNRYLDPQKTFDVLDVGGGTGIFADALSQLGHSVTVIDSSEEILSKASETYQNNPLLTFTQASIQAYQTDKQFDLVVCHAVLEWLNSPLDAINHLLSWLRPGGLLSLSFFNQDAKLFANALYGNFDYIEAGMQVKNQVRLNPQNPQRPDSVLNALGSQPVDVLYQRGIRCFHDYMQDKSMQKKEYEKLKALELAYGEKHPYLWLGKYFHIIARRR